MVAKELAIQRLGGKFWSDRFLGSCKKRACCGGGRRQIELEDSKNV